MLALAAVAGTAALAGVFPPFPSGTEDRHREGSGPSWAEAAWPFQTDPFGPGKAYRCSLARCGAEIWLYVRPKLGLCNCSAGVADDDDLDRMGDLHLVGDKATPLLPGRPVAIGTMRGRSRVYELEPRNPSASTAISLAVNDRCDMIVATLVVPNESAAGFEAHMIAFLNSVPMLRWAEVMLGL